MTNRLVQDDPQSSHMSNVPDKMDWYVYYRVRAEFSASLQLRVTLMQDRLLREFGIAGALKRRPQSQDGMHTWMEVYAGAPPDFDAILASAVLVANLTELVDGVRHTEQFLDGSSCA
jgi:hypothetical protein